MVLKFEVFLVDLFGRGEVERADFVGLGSVEELEAGGAETFGDLVFAESEEGGDGVDAPAMKDVGEFGGGTKGSDVEGVPELLGVADEVDGGL